MTASWEMIDDRRLGLVRDGAVLINTARGLEALPGVGAGSGEGAFSRQQDGCERALLYRRADWSVTGLALDPHDPDLILASTSHGVFRSADGGHVFTATQGPEAPRQHDFVRRDPHRRGRFVTAPHFGDIDIPLHESLDSGRTRQPLKQTHAQADLSDYPSYITTPADIGAAVSEIAFHPEQPGTFFITGCFGVSRTDDAGNTFTGQGFNGTETICVEATVTDPRTDRIAIAMADHSVAVSSDGGQTFQPSPGGHGGTAALAFSLHESGLLLWGAGGKRRNDTDAHLLRSTDGGRTAEVVHTFVGHRFLQALAAAPAEQGRFYTYVDGVIDDSPHSAGLYRSDDTGLTWNPLPSPFPDSPHRLPAEEDWIESELLPVVVYQKRNGAGANQLLACEPMRWTGTPARILVSDDRGNHWQDIHPAEHGALRWKGIALDRHGTLHAATCGNGVYRATPALAPGRDSPSGKA
ncbi:hypothetical protein [Streptomyces sp. NPDC048641]|uniref:hypothetical protein n=1 Tax=Streptomyces sp. NPDC048641 TaxID=3154825 RepID=UPI00341AB6EB